MAMTAMSPPTAVSPQKAPIKKKPDSSITGIMHRAYEPHQGQMDRPWEIDHILAGEYVGREEALRFVLAKYEEHRLYTLAAAGGLEPDDFPGIKQRIIEAREQAAADRDAAEAAHGAAKSAYRDVRVERGQALRKPEIVRLNRSERELTKTAEVARGGLWSDEGKLLKWGHENYQNNIDWAERQNEPLSADKLAKTNAKIEELKAVENQAEKDLEKVQEQRDSTRVCVSASKKPGAQCRELTFEDLEADYAEKKDAYEQSRDTLNEREAHARDIGRPSAKVTSTTLVRYFLAAYEAKLAGMDARALLDEFQGKIAAHPGLMPDWGVSMTADFAGLYYHTANAGWHDPRALLRLLAARQAAELGGDEAAAILAKPSTTRPGVAKLTKYLTYEQIAHLDDARALGLLRQYWQRGIIPVDAWRYIVTRTRLRYDVGVVEELMAVDSGDQETSEAPGSTDVKAYYANLVANTRNSTIYLGSIADPSWQALLTQWKSKEYTAWRRRGREEAGTRTTIVQKSNVCNETAEIAQFRRGGELPGGLWRNVKWYVENGKLARLQRRDQLIPGASLFRLEWMERLKRGQTNGARYHSSIPYVTEGGRRIFRSGMREPPVIGDWRYHQNLGGHSIVREIPLGGPRPLMSGVRDPHERHAEGAKAGDLQYLQWKHMATILDGPWDLGSRSVVMTWETRHGGASPNHLGSRARRLSDIVGHWNYWIGTTAEDEAAARVAAADHQRGLAEAVAEGVELPDAATSMTNLGAEDEHEQ